MSLEVVGGISVRRLAGEAGAPVAGHVSVADPVADVTQQARSLAPWGGGEEGRAEDVERMVAPI
jgi:hypothetical protein